VPEGIWLKSYIAASREEVLPFIPDRARRILDVGCGPGGFGAILAGRTVHGVEPNPVAADLAAEHYDAVFRGIFPDALPANEIYDCVVFNDVLEHMIDPWAAVRFTHQILSPGGTVVASLPNMRYLPVFKGYLLGDWTYQETGVMDNSHLRWFTVRTMRALFEGNGFRVQQVKPICRRRSWKATLVSLIPSLRDLPAQQFVIVATPAARVT
jgi:2-polyprenyl-3-methyl-5-hydroxy-6-metoxy-1,4-benzoquinol methylase